MHRLRWLLLPYWIVFMVLWRLQSELDGYHCGQITRSRRDAA